MGNSARGKEVTLGAAVCGRGFVVERTPPVRRPARREARLLFIVVDDKQSKREMGD